MTNYRIVFNSDKADKMYNKIEHLNGGWIRCSSPTIDAVETKRYPPTAIKEIIEIND